MRSVFVFLRYAGREELTNFLREKYPVQSSPWIHWVGDDACLYIDFYNDLETEFSDEGLADIRQRFGGLPSVSLGADVSGRHPGDREVRDFISLLLETFEGLAGDDYSDHFWSLEEVLSDRAKLEDGSEVTFFNYQRRVP